MRKITNLILIIFVLSLALPLSALAIGQVTKPIIIENVLQDSEVIDTLDLFNSEDEEIVYGLKTEGKIADWVSFYKIDDTNLENPITEVQVSPESYLKVTVKFTIPEYTPNGEYSGKVYIFTTPTEDEDTGEMRIAVGQRIGRKVSITVTDKQILKLDTTIIPLIYSMGKDDPLKIKVIYNNQGNVLIEPDIQLKITQINTGKVVQVSVIYPYPENENPVKPFERKVFENLIEWPTDGKENGRYLAEIKVLLNGEVVKETDFKFYIGFDWSKLFASIAVIGGGNLTFAWFIIGGILAALAGILAVFHKNPKLFKTKFFKVGVQRIRSIF